MKLKLTKDFFFVVLFGGAALLAPQRAFGQTILSNLGQSPGGVNSTSNVEPAEQDAQAFTTGNSAVTLASITLPLANNGSNGVGLGVTLYSNNSGIPGTEVAALTAPAGLINGAAANYVFTAAAGTLLQANTTYWIVTSDDQPTGAYSWTGTASQLADAGSDPTWQIGATLENFPDLSSWGNFNPALIQQFSVQTASAAPEPTTLALMALGLGGMVLIRRWRRQNG